MKQRKSARKGGFAATLLCAGAALMVAVPSATLALGVIDGDSVSSFSDRLSNFTPASVDPELARLVAEHSAQDGKQMRFTPAGTSSRLGRSITVAVRVDEGTARAISVRQALAAADVAQAGAVAPHLTSTRFNLGVARGYESFARAPALPKTLMDEAAIPDLAAFKPTPGAKDKPSRFNARIALDEVAKAGRDTRTRDGLGDQTVDLGGSYSVTRNLELTAGVRYSQDRDRLEPLTNANQDSQAVYVGTQFRF